MPRSSWLSKEQMAKNGIEEHISIREAKAFLKEAQWRKTHEEDGWPGGRDKLEVLYKDKWRELGSTDAAWEVPRGTTVWCSNSEINIEYYLKEFINAEWGGAYITADAFFIINASTDH